MSNDIRTANAPANHTPTRTRAALAEFSDPASLAVWDGFLDRVYTKALETGTPDPIRAFLASTWTSIDAARDYADYGWTGDRITADEFLATWQASHPGQHIADLPGGMRSR